MTDATDAARDLYDRGVAAAAAGDHQEAVECFTRAVGHRPDVATAYRGRAASLVALGRAGEALADLDRVVRIKPKDPLGHFERAGLRLAQRLYAGCVEDCDTVLSLDPGWAPAYGLRARGKAFSGDTAGALADLAVAIEREPEAEVGHRLFRAAELADRVVTVQPFDCAGPAIADCEAVIRLEPDNSWAYFVRGNVRRDTGDPAGAEADYTEALDRSPDLTGPRLARAQLRASVGRWADAAADCDALQATRPSDGLALRLRADCRLELGDYAGAEADCTAFLARMRTAADYTRRCRVRAAAGDHAGAVADGLAALKLDPDYHQALDAVARLWATGPDRRPADARAFAERACELTDRRHPDYLATLALTTERADD